MIRSILAVISGGVAGCVVNMAIVMLSMVIFPMPPGTDFSNKEAMKTYIDALPLSGFLLVLLAHEGGTFAGGFVAGWIAKRWQIVLGGIIGGLFLVAGFINLQSIPLPTWFAIVDLVLYVPCGIAGAMLAQRFTSSSAAPAAS